MWGQSDDGNVKLVTDNYCLICMIVQKYRHIEIHDSEALTICLEQLSFITEMDIGWKQARRSGRGAS